MKTPEAVVSSDNIAKSAFNSSFKAFIKEN